MNALAVGIDLVDVTRVRDLLQKHGTRFEERTFTATEREYCRHCADPAMHYAARFAAKEAVAKALGTGFAEGVSWTEIEVRRAANGTPSIALEGGAAKKAKSLGIKRWLLSLTHTKDMAGASVVACGSSAS